MDGISSKVNPGNIKIEVSRNPTLSFGVDYSYYTAVAYMSSIMKCSLKYLEFLDLHEDILVENIDLVERVEKGFKLKFLPFLNCLSFDQENESFLYGDEIKTPPLISEINPIKKFFEKKNEIKTYVSISGIKGLFDVYKEALELDHKIFTNNINSSRGRIEYLNPNFIHKEQINYLFARAAWNTIWLSNTLGIRLICPDFIKGDHPEIFFNLKTIEKFKLGHVWDSKKLPLRDFLSKVDPWVQKTPTIYSKIKYKYGTLDGLEYCANHIADDFLNGKSEYWNNSS